MNNQYTIVTLKYFEKKYLKLIKNNKLLKKKVIFVFKALAKNPFYPSLKTHKVISSKTRKKWASFVTSDIRIIWDFDGKKLRVILIYDIGSHSGKNKVYK